MSGSAASFSALHAYPMHGQHKLINEGFRTRDGHLMEWMAAALGPSQRLAVHSRPEPWILAHKQRLRRQPPELNRVEFDSPRTFRIPRSRDRQRWWVESLGNYRELADDADPAIIWNPVLPLAPAWKSIATPSRRMHVDLLDNWLDHSAFKVIEGEVAEGYRRLFDTATSVTANSEDTLSLAQSFGRTDARLILNGCDPERFQALSQATGPTTVGYLGKIGFRLDLPGMLATIDSLPHMNFCFAGPILDPEYRSPLAVRPNVRLLGDVHYSEVPDLLNQFDLGWVPHGVGDGREVGGDVIKIYEYRAAGLPVITTPVIGAGERGLSNVLVSPIAEHAEAIAGLVGDERRVPRQVESIPSRMTWQHKAREIWALLAGEN